MEPIEEATTRITTLKNGKNDVIQEIPPKLYSTVKQQSSTNIDEVPGIGYFYLAFNCKSGPTTDPLVREAVDYCFDMDQAVNNYVVPTGLRQYSPLPKPLVKEWEMPIKKWKKIPHKKNIGKAKQLFEKAGVDSGYSWKIIVPPDDKREQIGISVSNGLQAAGFDASVQRLEWGSFLDTYNTGKESDYNMYTLGWSGLPDPDFFTYYMFAGTDDVRGVTDGTFYSQSSKNGKQASENFIKARQTNDHAKRKKLYEEGISLVLNDRAHLPSYNLKNSFGVRSYVKDFESHPVDTFHLVSESNNVSIEK
ncbi:MAG TPA: ABC transporter substrate-binding protein, partial [Halococcus sp.]|nr:ABC transporter substrate-binding protein [Halococcus sp.]